MGLVAFLSVLYEGPESLDVVLSRPIAEQGLTVDMDKGLLFKLSYINRISMPVYRGRTPLNMAEIEVCGTNQCFPVEFRAFGQAGRRLSWRRSVFSRVTVLLSGCWTLRFFVLVASPSVVGYQGRTPAR